MLLMSQGITTHPAICHGKPVIEGTRVLVSTILGALAGGDTREMISEDYQLSSEQISCALLFAAEMANFQVTAYDVVA